VSFEGQMVSWDGCPGIFSCQMEAVVFIILQTFFVAHLSLKIG